MSADRRVRLDDLIACPSCDLLHRRPVLDIGERSRCARCRSVVATRKPRTIERTLAGEIKPRESFADKDRLKKRERPFQVQTSITFDNEGSDIYTIVEVDTRDRPGLLYDLSRTLAEANINIGSAVIATYGEQAVDTFYVKDLFGLKLHSDARRKSLETRLRDAITAATEWEWTTAPAPRRSMAKEKSGRHAEREREAVAGGTMTS